MIQGRKPNGYFVTGDGEGHRIEGETHHCIHCQAAWTYNPYDETRARNIRGFCLRCYGYLCMLPACAALQREMLLDHPGRECVSFEYHYRHRLERIAKSSLFEVTPGGIIMPRAEVSDIPGLEGVGRQV